MRLAQPEAPDPFVGVETVSLLGRIGGQWFEVGEGRWDQGPLPFSRAVDPRLDRLVVLGRAADGTILSSGASGPLSLAGPPTEVVVDVLFTRVGALSRLSEAGEAGAPRRGAEALGLPDGRVLVLGGTDAAGCARTDTELWSLEGAEAGPVLPRGRVGAQPRLLPGGEVVLLGGEEISGCAAPAPAQDVLLLNPEAKTVRRLALAEPLPSGAAPAVVDDSLVLWAGGDGDPIHRSEVIGLDPRGDAGRRLGALDAPRGGAAAVGLGDGRVLVVGGGGRPGQAPYEDASVFDVRRGAALTERIPVGAGLRQPLLAPTRAGGVLVAGGIDERGVGQRPVRVVVVGEETSVPLGDTSLATALTSSIGHGRQVLLPDGSWLLLPTEAGAQAHWVRMLPLAAEPVAGPEGPLVGGVRADGQAWLQGEDGVRYAFNPGPVGWLGPALTEGRLSLDRVDARPYGVGLVPLRPGAWQLSTRGLEGRGQAFARTPTEWAVIGGETFGDFVLDVQLRLAADAQAALLFGLSSGDYDYVALAGSALMGRSPGRAVSNPVNCPAVPISDLLGPSGRRVRLRRDGPVVRIDVGADDAVELECALPEPREGFVALGVVRGAVTFDALTLRRAP